MSFKLLAPASIGNLVFIFIIRHQLIVAIRVRLILVLGQNQLYSRPAHPGVTKRRTWVGHEIRRVACSRSHIRHLP
jgi:hypothetical protein